MSEPLNQYKITLEGRMYAGNKLQTKVPYEAVFEAEDITNARQLAIAEARSAWGEGYSWAAKQIEVVVEYTVPIYRVQHRYLSDLPITDAEARRLLAYWRQTR